MLAAFSAWGRRWRLRLYRLIGRQKTTVSRYSPSEERNTGSIPERDLVDRLVSPPPAADRSRVKLGAFVWYGKWRRGPDSHTPLKHWSCPCPKASLGPSRPSFIDEVHAADAACALS